MTFRRHHPDPDDRHRRNNMIDLLENAMTDVNADQAKLNDDTSRLGAAVATVIAELKAQAAAGVPLDFTAADQLVASVEAEAAADAPPVVPPAV